MDNVNRRVELMNQPDTTEVDPGDEQTARQTLLECRDFEEMFATTGWPLLIKKLEVWEAASVSMLEGGAKSMELILAHRSRLQLIRELLALEDATAKERADATELIQEDP